MISEHEAALSPNEKSFLEERVFLKSIPTPKILIKDHKTPNDQGDFPTRLVVPATNFTAGFPKLGYMSIQELFKKHNISYGQRNLIQASDLKEQLEKLNLTRQTHSIASVNAEMFYPSVKYWLIE